MQNILGIITSGTLLMLCIIGAAILLPAFYYTVKAAVKNGTAEAIREANQQEKESITRVNDKLPKKQDSNKDN